MATVTVHIHCPRCDSDEVYRHGLSPTKRERFRCQCCRRVFQHLHQHCHSGFKKLAPRWITSSLVTHTDVALTGGVLAYTFGPRTDET
ncbi:IS1 family transposase, partial [Candidatus Erwinia dacicola]|uniref:IS1 family transposase n=1 Tax=Candidatus Erwinia dacicola TaxID=252393 RepID=UPI0030B81759